MKITKNTLKLCKKLQIILFIIQFTIIFSLIYFKCNYVINVTPSLPLGIYILEKVRDLKQGDIVLFDIDEEAKQMMYERGYIPAKNTKLLKTIGALENNKINVVDSILYVDGENYGRILEKDLENRKLPSIEIKMDKGNFLALTKKKLSYDSRYFGQVNLDKIEKKAKLVYEFK